MYKCVVFDLDGTLMDTSYGIIKSVNLSLQKENLEVLPFEKIIPYIGGGAKKLIRSLFTLMNIEGEELYARVCKSFYEYYYIYCDTGLRIFFDIGKVITMCNDKKIIISLYTNKDMRFTEKILHTLNIKFDEVMCPPDFPLKPDISGISYLLKKYDISNTDIVLVGDSKVDYQTSLNCNIHCILVTWGFSFDNSLTECKGATVINDPQELIKFLALI